MSDTNNSYPDDNTYSQSTPVLLAALNTLRKKDFTVMMGSGIIVTLRSLEGKEITAPFTIDAEDMESIKPAIIESLIDTLGVRKSMRLVEIRDIEAAIGPK